MSLRYGAARAARKAVLGSVLTVVALPAAAEEVVIAMLGDSLTHGYGLPDFEGLVPQLQGWMDAHGVETRLINAGVSGDTTAGGLARLDWTLTPEVDALVVELGANDMLRGVPVDTVRVNLDAILQKGGDRGLPILLIGVQATPNFGPDYKAGFDAVFPQLAEKHGAALFPDFFAPLIAADDGSQATRSRLMQDDGLHPSREGVALIVEALGPAVAALAAEAAE